MYGIFATAAGCARGVTVQYAFVGNALANVNVQAVVADPKVILPPWLEEPASTVGDVPQVVAVGTATLDLKCGALTSPENVPVVPLTAPVKVPVVPLTAPVEARLKTEVAPRPETLNPGDLNAEFVTVKFEKSTP